MSKHQFGSIFIITKFSQLQSPDGHIEGVLTHLSENEKLMLASFSSKLLSLLENRQISYGVWNRCDSRLLVYSTNHQIYSSRSLFIVGLERKTLTLYYLYWHCDRFVCQGWKINDINFWRNSQRIHTSICNAYQINVNAKRSVSSASVQNIKRIDQFTLSVVMRYRAISNRMCKI